MSLSGTRGVFSLRQIYNSQRKGTGFPIADVFTQRPSSAVPNVGYSLDGRNAVATMSLCQKTTYSNDTLARVPGGDAALGGAFAGATVCSETNQYKMGGQFPSGNPQSNTERFSFSTETCTYVPGANITEAKDYCAGLHNNDAGYRAGGSPGGTSTVVDKLTYSSDTTARVPSADLTAGHNFSFSGFSNSSVGYYSGGFSGSSGTSLTTKLTFAGDTSARAPSADMTSSRYASTAASNGSTIGYVAFGDGPKSSVEKFSYSGESYALAPTAQLAAAKKYGRGTSNGTAAYLMGGHPGAISYQQKINYSNDTRSTLPSAANSLDVNGIRLQYYGSPRQNALPTTTVFPIQQFTTGYQPGPNAGYFGGGTPGTISDIQKADFTTETSSTLPATLTQARGYLSQGSTNENGYFNGGILSSTRFSIVDKFAYSSETISTLPTAGQMSAARYGTAGASSPSNMYIGGGFQPGSISFTDKLTFSTDTRSAGPNISQNRGYMGAITNLNNIFFLGGWQGSASLSVVDKLSTSGDTLARAPGLNLPIPIHGVAGCGDSDNGYARGGFDAASVTNTQKINYSTETSSLVPTAMMEWNSHNHADSGNFNNGYTTGDNGGSTKSVSKLNYASETSSTTGSQDLPLAKGGMGGIGAGNFGRIIQALPTPSASTFPVPQSPAAPPITGYVTSGETSSGNVSSSEKLNMSTDAYAAVPSMNLPSGVGPSGYRTYAASASSPTNGYMMGGYAPNFSDAARVNYVTETFSSIPGAPTVEARRSVGQGSGSSTIGIMAGGYSEAQSPARQVSNVDKLVYSNEAFVREPGMTLSEQRGGMGTVSNQTNCYMICGNNGPSSRSIVDKITYAADTTARVPGANDPTPRSYPRSNYFPSPERGYHSGGRDSPSNTTYSLTTRLNFSDDTSSAVPGANMTIVRAGGNACTGNTTHTYQSGGTTPAKTSLTDKLNMSTETFGAAPSANLAAPTEAQSGYGPYMNGNPSTSVPQAPNPTPNYC